jgi:hypothetical protein
MWVCPPLHQASSIPNWLLRPSSLTLVHLTTSSLEGLAANLGVPARDLSNDEGEVERLDESR